MTARDDRDGEEPGVMWAPRGIDVRKANPARVYNCLLGGKDHYAADREAAEELLAVAPQVRDAMQQNRWFLQRAVAHLAEAGIRQFIDLGTGLPSEGNVHEIAQLIAPDVRVVYIDRDPVVLAHGRALLADEKRTVMIEGDARDPGRILADPELRALIDFSRPVGVLFVALLHFVSDAEDPAGVVAAFRDAIAPGSYLVISHATAGPVRRADLEEAARLYSASTAPIALRDPEQVAGFFEGFELVPPGLVYAEQWRPWMLRALDDQKPPAPVLAGVGYKPPPVTAAGLPRRGREAVTAQTAS